MSLSLQLCVTVDVRRELVCVITHAIVQRATLDSGVPRKVKVHMSQGWCSVGFRVQCFTIATTIFAESTEFAFCRE